jgi:hypothetical protein
MQAIVKLLLGALLFVVGANAQFQFFEQMFQGGQQQHQHQAPKDVPSDSSWYQQNYDNGRSFSFFFHGSANTAKQPIAQIIYALAP